jgi:acyl carrier protein
MRPIQDNVISIISEWSGVKPHLVQLTHILSSDLGIDELDVVEIIMELEEELEFEFSEGHNKLWENYQTMTVSDVVSMVEESVRPVTRPDLVITPEVQKSIREAFSGVPMPKCKPPKGSTDKGKHYRYSYRVNVGREHSDIGYIHINLDPYRICQLYSVGGGCIEHIIKKALRGSEKGHNKEDLLKEIICCAERGLEMLEEDK